MTWAWKIGPLAMLVTGGMLVVAACGTKGAVASHDGGPGDASTDASHSPPDAGADATARDASDASDALSSFDATFQAPDVEGPCHASADCPGNEICCESIVARKSGAACVVATKCPTGGFEPCGTSGKGLCHPGGKCRPYQCTFSVTHTTSDLYACESPVIQGVACAPGPDGGFPPTHDAGDGGF